MAEWGRCVISCVRAFFVGFWLVGSLVLGLVDFLVCFFGRCLFFCVLSIGCFFYGWMCVS